MNMIVRIHEMVEKSALKDVDWKNRRDGTGIEENGME